MNKTPLVPLGTKILLYSKPGQQKNWSYHGEQGWYVGPAPTHYRCVRCYISKTHKERIIDTVNFIPRQIPIPNATITEHLRKTADDLIHLLYKYPKMLSPTEPDSTQRALLEIAKLLHRDTTPTIIPLLKPQSLEGVQQTTLEGIIADSRIKTTITPVMPPSLPLHPSLYKTTVINEATVPHTK